MGTEGRFMGIEVNMMVTGRRFVLFHFSFACVRFCSGGISDERFRVRRIRQAESRRLIWTKFRNESFHKLRVICNYIIDVQFCLWPKV
jgi:hypothetical protein